MALTFVATIASQAAMSGETTTGAISDALARRVCFDVYWEDRTSVRLGATIPLEIRIGSDFSYGWTTSLERRPHISKWANYFALKPFSGREIVVSEEGFDVDAVGKTANYLEKRAKVFNDKARSIPFKIPSNCEPMFDPKTNAKSQMMSAVVSSIRHQFGDFNENSGTHYPRQLKVIIGNFNIDYPATWIYIDATREVFMVNFSSEESSVAPNNYRNWEYVLQQVDNPDSVFELSKKIRREGISLVVTLESPR